MYKLYNTLTNAISELGRGDHKSVIAQVDVL